MLGKCIVVHASYVMPFKNKTLLYSMGNYRYTELSYKITLPFFAHLLSGYFRFDLYIGWCGSDAIYMQFLSKYYNKNIFNTFQLSVPVAVNITLNNYATCKACPFIFTVLYTQVPTVAPPTDGRVVYMISHFITHCIS